MWDCKYKAWHFRDRQDGILKEKFGCLKTHGDHSIVHQAISGHRAVLNLPRNSDRHQRYVAEEIMFMFVVVVIG